MLQYFESNYRNFEMSKYGLIGKRFVEIFSIGIYADVLCCWMYRCRICLSLCSNLSGSRPPARTEVAMIPPTPSIVTIGIYLVNTSYTFTMQHVLQFIAVIILCRSNRTFPRIPHKLGNSENRTLLDFSESMYCIQGYHILKEAF